MPWSELFRIAVLLLAAVVFGQLWFHFVESLLERTRRLFRRDPPPAWHTLPDEKEDDNGHQ